MDDLLLVALAGFLASLVDGALGMGFGPTSATVLLASGIPATSVSTMVNLAKVATGTASAAAHWRLGNIDRGLVARLALSGAIGAAIGTTLLRAVDGDALRPILAGLLALVGVRMLLRFSRPLPPGPAAAARPSLRPVAVVGAAGGVTNGLIGAWGPVVTPYLLHRGIAPRIAVGSVNTAEIAVAVTAVGSLLGGSGRGIDVALVAAMLTGGVAAAPVAAIVIRRVPARALGLAVAGLLLLTQTRELTASGLISVEPSVAYGVVVASVAVAATRARRVPLEV